MLTELLMTFVALVALIGGWVAVQALARRFAARHPETGPFREAGGGCGGCGGEPCSADADTFSESSNRQGH